MFEFATKHFLVLSSGAIIIAAALSMIVLSSYLAVFDWNLIWLIEYSDLTKLFLIGAALVGSLATTLIHQTQDMFLWVIKKSTRLKWTILFGAGFTLLISGAIIYYDIKSANGREAYDAFRAASFFLFLFLIYIIFHDRQAFFQRNWYTIASHLAIFTFFLGSIGATYGYYVRDVSTRTREIWTKDEKFLDAKLIMFLAHHTAFIADNRVIVLSTPEIIRVVSKPELR